MVIEESTELIQADAYDAVHLLAFSMTISTRYIYRKQIVYDHNPTYEIQDMIDDGWVLEKLELSHYYQQNPFHTVIMTRYSDKANPTNEEVLIPSAEKLNQQISNLFEDKWNDI